MTPEILDNNQVEKDTETMAWPGVAVLRRCGRGGGSPEESDQMDCPCCGTSFAPRQSGGKRQTFCYQRCRRNQEAALRTWAQDQLAKRSVTIADLQRACCADEQAPSSKRKGLPKPVAGSGGGSN